jgi:protein-disulfide isomerase
VVLSLDSPLLLGNINGPNTLIVFTDFQCPACKRASDIVQSFSKRGDTKIIIKNYPLSNECNKSVNHNMHPWSCLAAMASVCAFEQGKFDEFYHTVYGNQASIHTKDELLRTLSFTSLDMNQLVGCIKGSWAENKVQQDIQAGNKINLQGTPTIYYNQKPVALDEFLQEK